MADSGVTVGQVIDSIPTGRFHRRLLLATGTIWATTAMEVLSISFTLSTFIEIWNLSELAAGLLGSAGLLGMIVGTTAGGWYSDRVGRKRGLAVSVALFSVFGGLTALATGFYSAFVLRLLTGIGVGGTIAADASYLSEHVPTERRGRYLAYLELFYALGNSVTVIVAWTVLSELSAGGTVFGIAAWRVFFASAALPVVLLLVVAVLPESPYYLARKNRTGEASDRLASIARTNDAGATTVSGPVRAGESDNTGFSRLFEPGLRKTTLLFSAVWFGLNFGYYGVFIWLPRTVEAAGYVGGLYAYLFLVSVFQILGVLSAAYLIDALGRKPTTGGSLVLAGAFTFLFASAVPGVGLDLGVSGRLPFLGGMLAMGFFIFGAFGVMFAYTSESFPTEVRSTGLGFATGVGKVAAVGGPVVVGFLTQYGSLVALAPVAASLVAAGIGLLLFGRETKGETLV
ncbi:MFS transporter [Halobacteriales archaeon QS_1_68_17]|nr:MAG: MFS transporter [Halobacteriales archaeon QS_1_68_17]